MRRSGPDEEYEGGPRNHTRLLRLALADLRDGARSAAEASAIRRLARGGVPPFEVNVPIIDQHGQLLRVVDLFWLRRRADELTVAWPRGRGVRGAGREAAPFIVLN